LINSAFADVANSPSNPMKINVDYMGYAWVTDIWGFIYTYTGDEWINQVGNAVDVQRGSNDEVWILDPYGTAKLQTGSLLEQVYLMTAT
jgi:hypothetical protein